MNGIELKRKLAGGEAVYGTMLTSRVPARWLWMMRQAELDFVCVDTEHAPLSRSDVAELVTGVTLVGCAPLVRIPTPDPTSVAQVLDAGAHGVMLPYCETVAEVAACVRAARMRPLKGERLAEAAAGKALPAKTVAELERMNQHSFVVIGIESVPAVERLDALLDAGAIDAVFVGTHDLSTSLGYPNELQHRVVKQTFARIVATCQARGVATGIWPLPIELAVGWRSRGMQFVFHGTDYDAMARSIASDFTKLRAAKVATARKRTR